MTNTKITKTEKKFKDIIRNKMTPVEFWNWVNSWFDPDNICRIAENWDIKDKEETIEAYEAGKFKK